MKRIQEKLEAIRLRKEKGLSISEIKSIINIPYETIKRWVKSFPLTNEQDIQLAIRNPNYKKSINAGKIYSERHRVNRLSSQKEGKRIAKRCKNSLWAIGAMLYWGEGSKCYRNTLDFTNSDPYMIKLFVRFLVEELRIEKNKIAITIQCYNDLRSIEEIENFWVGTTGLDKDNLRKTIINKYPISSKKTKIGKSEYGTCKLRVGDVNATQKIFGFIKEIAGIEDENMWLG